MIEHGTRRSYNHGCRCDECRHANTEYYRSRSHKKRYADWAATVTDTDRERIGIALADIVRRGPDDLASEVNAYLESERRRAALEAGAAKRNRVGPTHGKPSTYSVYGCRCDACRTSYMQWKRERRDKN